MQTAGNGQMDLADKIGQVRYGHFAVLQVHVRSYMAVRSKLLHLSVDTPQDLNFAIVHPPCQITCNMGSQFESR